MTTKKFDESALKELLVLSQSKKEIVSKIIEVKSLDGTKIPVRLTHLKSLVMNNQNPVYFHIYGGFGVSDFAAQHQTSLELFLERGGILVKAAVRGGNEYGLAWQKAAQFENKVKTFEDVAAVGMYLNQAGYSSPNKIVLIGGSNGGMVAAATVQRFPGVFGLAVVNNGVHDMLRRHVLDTSNGDSGWASEFGDSSKEEVQNYSKGFSPVETAKNGPGSNFLIVNGRQDSRVNPAHSFKLKAALSDANTKGDKFVYMTSINNSGHAVESPQYQDLIGWRAQVVTWAMIYDFLGISF